MQSQVMQWFYKGPWILVSSFNTPFSFVSFKFKFQVYLQNHTNYKNQHYPTKNLKLILTVSDTKKEEYLLKKARPSKLPKIVSVEVEKAWGAVCKHALDITVQCKP